MTSSYTFLAIGPANPEADRAWLASPFVGRIFRHRTAAIGGKRFGSRVLGIGVDSLLLAVRTLSPNFHGPYLANNPWIGAALRLTGRNNFVVTGVYAEPASRSWKILRGLIGAATVITLSESEAGPWNAAGGRAVPVLYGNTFHYPPKQATDLLHIFVGGTSDRDRATIAALEAEVLASKEPVRLTVATGEPKRETGANRNVVSRPGPLSAQVFGEVLSTADVLFLPLLDGTRAAGHMVMVGALESGVPVGMTASGGMTEYRLGDAIELLHRDQALLPQLRALAEAAKGREDSIRQLWREVFSLDAYIARVGKALKA